MIVNIRGTSGSGKSHLVRAVMTRYACRPVHGERATDLLGPIATARPIGHECEHETGRRLWVVGPYDKVGSGGADLLRWSRDDLMAMVRERAAAQWDVIFEGLVASDIRRTIGLHASGLPVLVVYLDVSLDECLAAVQARRRARGDERPLSPWKTSAKHRDMFSERKLLLAAGMDVRAVSREEGLRLTLEALGV